MFIKQLQKGLLHLKKTFFCLAALIIANSTRAQSCNDETIMNTKGHWAKRNDAIIFPDSSFSKNQYSQLYNRIDKMQKLLQAAYPDPAGAEAGWYRVIDGKALVKAGPVPYQLNALFLPYYCNGEKIERQGETGTWSYIWANRFNWFAQPVGYFTIKQQPVYLLGAFAGELNGYPIYKGIETDSRTVILTRSGQLPYIPVTKKQYLLAFIKYNEKKQQESIAAMEKNIPVKTDNEEAAYKQKQLEIIEKVTSADKVERVKENFLKNYITDKQQKEKQIAEIKDGYNMEIKKAQDLLANNMEEELQQDAIIKFLDFTQFKGFSTKEDGGRAVVRLNPDYFNIQLPKYMPQFLIVYWKWDKIRSGENFKEQIENHFDLTSLATMIDK